MRKIGIVGNGFVGSAVAHGFGLHSEIMIYDADPNRSQNSLDSVVNNCEFIFIGVPTPMSIETGGTLDLSIMDDVFDKINDVWSQDSNPIFIVKSTVVPGSVEKYVAKYPKMRIVFNPEFLTERSARLDFINASRIVLGGAKNDVDDVENLYRERFPYTKIIKTDHKTAQFIKYMCNCFFATKVSFMNEMKQASDAFGCTWNDIMDGFVSDGRIGNSHLDVPGHDGSLGFGGKCFPKDINAFIGFFNDIGVNPTIMKAAWEKNIEVRKDKDWLQIEGAVSKHRS